MSTEKKSFTNRISDYWTGFENSAMPVALKWSLSIGLLITLGMGLLGTYLITQHELSYQQQANNMGGIIVEQLAHASSEPLMADDVSALELMLEQQIKNPALSGLDIRDNRGNRIADAGLNPVDFESDKAVENWPCQVNAHTQAKCTVFTAPIRYKDVLAGYARITLNNELLEQSLEKLRSLLIAATAVFILLTVLLAFPLARRLARPIHQLAASIEARNSFHVPARQTSSAASSCW